MKTSIVLVFTLLISLNCYAYEWFTPFDTEEKILQGTYILVTCIDWAQTKEFRADGRREMNPILGSEPSQERVDTLIGLAIISHTLIAYALPQEFRETWSVVFIVVELEAVTHNYAHGHGPKLSLNYKF
jgi:hypothetical protein